MNTIVHFYIEVILVTVTMMVMGLQTITVTCGMLGSDLIAIAAVQGIL